MDQGRRLRLARPIAIDPTNPNNLFAVSFAELRGSTNGGTTWSTLTGAPQGAFTDLAIDPVTPSTVYAVAESGYQDDWAEGILKSTDGGTTWAEINVGLPDGVTTLAIDPVRPRVVYAGGRRGLFRSTNGGLSWSSFDTGLPSPNIASIVVDPTDPNVVYVGTSGTSLWRRDIPRCAPAPVGGCRSATNAKLAARASATGRYKLAWRWRGAGTILADFGNPEAADDYTLCIYDASGGSRLVHEGAALAGASWSARGPAFRYRDRFATIDTPRAVGLSANASGAKIKLDGKELELTAGAYALPVTAQAVRAEGSGHCWEAVYASADANSATAFKAQLP